MFVLEDLDMKLIIKNCDTYNEAFRRDLAKAIVVISNPKQEKDIATAIAKAVCELDGPEYLIDEGKFKMVKGVKKTLHDFAFEFAIMCGEQSTVSTMEFMEHVFTEFGNKKRAALDEFSVWLYNSPVEWLSKLKYHKCFSMKTPLDWDYCIQGRMKSCKEVVDYFKKYQPSGAHRLEYVRNAFFFCMSDGSEAMPDTIDDRIAICRDLLPMWKDDKAFWKTNFMSLGSKYVPVFDALVPKLLLPDILAECGNLLYAYLEMAEEQEWDKEKCLKFFGDDQADLTKYKMDKSNHAVEKATSNADWIDALTAADLRRLLPDWSKLPKDMTEEKWWDCDEGQSIWQCCDASHLKVLMEVVPTGLLSKWLLVADNYYPLVDGYNDDNVEIELLLEILACRGDDVKMAFGVWTKDYNPIIAIALKDGAEALDAIVKLLPKACTSKYKKSLEANMKTAKVDASVISAIMEHVKVMASSADDW
jgi:hypothetical protein